MEVNSHNDNHLMRLRRFRRKFGKEKKNFAPRNSSAATKQGYNLNYCCFQLPLSGNRSDKTFFQCIRKQYEDRMP